MSYIFEIKMKDLASSSFAKLLDLDQDFNKNLGKTNLSLDQMRKKVEDLKVIRNLTTDMKELGNANKGIDMLESKISKLSSFKGGGALTQFKDQLMNSVPGMGQFSGMGAALTSPIGAAAVGVSALVAAGVKGTQMAMDFEKGMAQVNTTAMLSKEGIKALGEQVREIGSNFNITDSELPRAFNQIISATGDADSALKLLKPTLELSKVGFMDTTTAASALTNLMGQYPNMLPTEALNILAAAVKKGKAEFGDFAEYMPRITPYMDRIGVGFEDAAGMVALFTQKGQSMEQTTMLLQNLGTAMSRMAVAEGSNKKGGFKGLGISLFDEKGERRKIEAVVQDLDRVLAGKSGEQRMKILDSIGLDAQASAAVNELLKNVKELPQFLEATRNSGGTFNQMLEASQNTSDKLGIAWKKLVDGPLLDLGNKILPYFTKFIEGISSSVDGMKQLYAESWLIRNSFKLLGGFIEYGLVAPLKGAWALLKMFFNEMLEKLRFVERVASGIKELITGDSHSFMNGYNAKEELQYGKVTKRVKKTDTETLVKGVTKEAVQNTSLTSENAAERSKLSAGVEGARSNSRPTNINITLEALAKGTVINAGGVERGVENFEKILSEKLLRVISGVNQLSLG